MLSAFPAVHRRADAGPSERDIVMARGTKEQVIVGEQHDLRLEWHHAKLLLLLVVTVLGAFFRLHRIGSLPPGDRYDPAFYGVDALRVLSGERPIFFYDYAGQHRVEPLFSYLVALCFLVVGPSTLGIHLAGALVGIVTVPAVYVAAEGLLSALPRQDRILLKRWGPLVAALMVAISYWHLTWSRYGVRAILVPLFASLVVAALWEGLRRSTAEGERGWAGRWSFVLCGVMLGASLYTYQAARLLPVLVVTGFGCGAWQRRRLLWDDLTNLLIVGLVALLIFAPLGIYFIRHPESFSARVDEVLVIEEGEAVEESIGTLWQQTRQALLSFLVGTDDAPYRTLPGRPSLNPVFSALLVLGIGWGLSRLESPVYAFLVVWLVLLSVPAALADQGSAAKRAIGALPAVAVLVAVGASGPLDLLGRRLNVGWRRRLVRATWVAALAVGFAYAGWATYRDYFVKWASMPGLSTHFEVERAAIGDYVRELPADERVYVSPEVPSHPVIRFHSGGRDDVQGYNGRVCFVVPERAETSTTYVIDPHQDQRSLGFLESTMPAGYLVDTPESYVERGSFVVYRIPAGSRAVLSAGRTVSAIWGDQMELFGFDGARESFAPGEKVSLTLYYRVLRDRDQRYTAFVHLLGPEDESSSGPLQAQYDSEPCHGFFATSSWVPGEIITDRIEVNVPDAAPVGTYRLVTGFYETGTGQRLGASGPSAADHDLVLLAEIEITDGPGS